MPAVYSNTMHARRGLMQQVTWHRRPDSTTTDRRPSNDHRLPRVSTRSYMRICYQSWPGSIGVNILTARIFRNIIGFASPSPRTCWETRWLCFATCLLFSENNDAIHDLQESVWCSSIYVICTSCWVFDDTARKRRRRQALISRSTLNSHDVLLYTVHSNTRMLLISFIHHTMAAL